jgi:peptidoglycan/xylan/chitin deacetylase (PgdA/CDA1 family)
MGFMSRFEVYARKRIAQRFSRKLAEQVSPSPIVSFTFDDFPRSALAVAGAMLADNGLRGTYYAAMGLLGHRTSMGEIFNAADLRVLVEAGHELSCHTFDHLYCLRSTGSEVQWACDRNRRAVAEILGGYRLRNFSYPSGCVTWSAKSSLTSIYDSCRTVEWGINANPVDLGFLRAAPVYSGCPIGKLQRLIAENAEQAGWLILYTHDVSPQPSIVGCTPAYFRDILSSAIASGASVVTVAEAVSRFRLRKDGVPDNNPFRSTGM